MTAVSMARVTQARIGSPSMKGGTQQRENGGRMRKRVRKRTEEEKEK
jgi:hypothetical protein